MRIAVVILNWNTEGFLRKFLPGLVRSVQAVPGAEVIVADNASDDGSINVMREVFPGVRTIIFEKNLGFTGGYLFVFVWGALGIRSGAVTYGMLVAFLQLVGQVQRPVAELARQIPSFIRSLSSADRLLDLEVLQREDRSDPVLIPGAPGIRVEDVSFSYPGAETPVLQSFSCQFLPGTMTVVLGPTGVGKSTLIRLVMALFQPDSGSVSLRPYVREAIPFIAANPLQLYVCASGQQPYERNNTRESALRKPGGL